MIMLCYITHIICHVMLYNTRYVISQMLCYITDDMLCYITHVMLCYITRYVILYNT